MGIAALIPAVAAAAIPMIQSALRKPDQANKVSALQGVATTAQAYRPEMAKSKLNALGNQLGAFGSANSVLGAMGAPKVDLQAAGADPRTAGMKVKF